MIPAQSTTASGKPLAEVLVEGELSPFEDEAIYRILRKNFQVQHPSYSDLSDEAVATRVSIVFHYPYSTMVFTDLLKEGWRDLKELLKQVRYRRGKAGAAFTIIFSGPETRILFNCGILEEGELSSALDQVGHLPGIIGLMLRHEPMEKRLVRIEANYDKRSDRWNIFQGFTDSDERYVFDEAGFRWVKP